MSKMPDLSLATADRYLYEAAMGNFYGSLTFSFKAGKLIMVRREQTEIVTTPSDTEQPMRNGEHSGESSGSHEPNGFRHRQ